MNRLSDPSSFLEGGADLAAGLYHYLATDAAAPAVFVADPQADYRLLHVSAACRTQYGADAPAERLPELIPALTAEVLQRLWTEVECTGRAALETDFCHVAGRCVSIEMSFGRLEHEGRGLMVGHVHDLTERKRMEEVLRFVARRGLQGGDEPFLTALVRFLGEALALDYVIVDRLADDPAQAETVALYARGEVLPNMCYSLHGTPCENVFEGDLCCYPAGVQRQFPEDALLVEMGVDSYAGIPLWDSTGKVIGLIAVMDGKPMRDPGSLMSILRLVATRVAAELEHELAERALAGSRTLLDRILDTIPDPVFVKDRQHRWIYLNQALCEVIGHPPEALLGKSDYDFFPTHEAEVFWAKDEAVFASGAVNINEETLTDGEGRLRIIATKKACFEDGIGNRFLVGCIRDITERKATQQRLELLEQAIDLSSDAIYLIDETLRFTYVNDAACRALGYSREELLALGPLAIDPDIDPDTARHLMRTTPLNTRVSLETRHRTRDGRTFPVEINATHFERDGARFSICVVRDIGERKRLESAMAAREREFRSLAENLPDNIARWDTQGRILVSNPTHQRTLGRPAAELIGKTHLEAFPDDRYRPVDAAIAQVVASGEPVVFVRQLVPAENGEMRIHDIKLVPEFDAAGQIVSVLGIGRDMTDIYRMQEAVAAREQEFRSLAENLPDNIGRWDAAGRYVYVNPTYERTLGISAASVIGKTVGEAFPERRESPVALAIARILATGEAALSVRQLVPAGNGEMRVHEVNLMPEKDAAGDIVGVLGIGRDMTDLYRMQEALAAREHEFRTLAENAPQVIIRYDRACRRIYTNPAYAQDVGIRHGEATDKTPQEFWRPTNIGAEEYMAQLRHVMDSGERAEVLLEWMSAEGGLHSSLLHLVAEYETDGRVRGVLAIGRDISASRRLEGLALTRMAIFESLTHGGDLPGVLERVAGFVETSNPTLLCGIMLADAAGERLLSGVAPSLPAFYNEAVDGLAIGEGIGCCGTAAWRKEPVLVEDIQQHPYWDGYRALAAQAGLAACWTFPMLGAMDDLLGTFAIYRREPGLPTATDLELIREACHLAVISIERKRGEEKLMHQASYDMLTGLPNRRLFGNRLHEEIARAERLGHNVALLFIDLDRFKEVNDNLGHEIGDGLLIEASRRIRTCVRESDAVARLGGDEFVVILPEVDELTHLGRVAQGIIDAMTRVFEFDAHSAYVSASIGIACYPADADNSDTLIGCADQAMYAAKQQGRNGFSFFTAAMQQQAQQRMSLARDLRDALAHGQLQVYYQPIVDITRQCVVKAEALLRWRHPARGMVPPDHFIPIAEETGVIHEIGDWVFKEAAELALRWRRMVPAQVNTHCPPQVSVNMSPRQFMRGNVGEAWVEYLHGLALPTDAMVVEITEGLLLGDEEGIRARLEYFRAAGIRIALDDFGTGYSAMGYLKKFNIDYLKIDRSFVRDLESDPNDRAIAEAIVVMARKLGLKTIAEGVETAGQRDILAAVGCEYVQGYYYAKPMPADEFLQHAVGTCRIVECDGRIE